MHNLPIIEECYKRFTRKLPHLLPEGIIDVNLKLLRDMNLLHFTDVKSIEDEAITRYFHVVETQEKITLINDEFIVWIVPSQDEAIQRTTVLVALNNKPMPDLELAFLTNGVYNTSWLVLRILEKMLDEIHENEKLIKSYQEAA
jgi:hypothetical protein